MCKSGDRFFSFWNVDLFKSRHIRQLHSMWIDKYTVGFYWRKFSWEYEKKINWRINHWYIEKRTLPALAANNSTSLGVFILLVCDIFGQTVHPVKNYQQRQIWTPCNTHTSQIFDGNKWPWLNLKLFLLLWLNVIEETEILFLHPESRQYLMDSHFG